MPDMNRLTENSAPAEVARWFDEWNRANVMQREPQPPFWLLISAARRLADELEALTKQDIAQFQELRQDTLNARAERDRLADENKRLL